MRLLYAVMGACLLLILAACGSSRLDRGLSGAAIGAGTGAAVGALTGTGMTSGALLGGAAGGATGALTSKRTIDLGRPIWRR
ncbi:MAG TPA: YMGG-like glycine zipper-containing protein [Geminicoccaceae bacterium]|nr:YMGG-like glycine zipper-containing protein [Geminicoccaceae bacterium]